MTPENVQTFRKPAHPMTGWLAVIPLPDPPTESEESTAGHNSVTFEVEGVGTVKVVDLRSVLAVQPGMEAAIVMEVGPIASSTDDEVLEVAIPYSEGCTVYYGTGGGLRLGGFKYLRIDQVIAWEPAP